MLCTPELSSRPCSRVLLLTIARLFHKRVRHCNISKPSNYHLTYSKLPTTSAKVAGIELDDWYRGDSDGVLREQAERSPRTTAHWICVEEPCARVGFSDELFSCGK